MPAIPRPLDFNHIVSGQLTEFRPHVIVRAGIHLDPAADTIMRKQAASFDSRRS